MIAHRIELLLAVICLAATSAAAQELKPEGQNCDLAAPPARSGEESVHGTMIKVFPRLRNIAAGYDGCQASWYQDESAWKLIGLTYFDRGKPTVLWSPLQLGESDIFCEYRSGQLVSGSAEDCPPAEMLGMRSVPEGCVARARAEGRMPADCRYE